MKPITNLYSEEETISAPWQDAQFAQLNIRLNPRLVQWVNRVSQLEPRQRRGGWFVERSFESEPLHIGAPSAVTFYSNHGNEPEEGYYYDAITIAPLADRFMWLDSIDRGWTQILGLAQGGETLVKLTGKGLTSRAYNRAIKNHNLWIARATDGQAPEWTLSTLLTASTGETPAPSTSAPPHQDSRYTNDSEGNRRGSEPPQSNAGAADNDASDLPTETLQRLLNRAGAAGIERFGRTLDLTLPHEDDAGAAVSTLVGEVPAAAWWEAVPQARRLANAWVNKFQAGRRQDEGSLDSLREYFKIEGTNPRHVAAVIALAWLGKPNYREQIEGWINVWATSLMNQTS